MLSFHCILCLSYRRFPSGASSHTNFMTRWSCFSMWPLCLADCISLPILCCFWFCIDGWRNLSLVHVFLTASFVLRLWAAFLAIIGHNVSCACMIFFRGPRIFLDFIICCSTDQQRLPLYSMMNLLCRIIVRGGYSSQIFKLLNYFKVILTHYCHILSYSISTFSFCSEHVISFCLP